MCKVIPAGNLSKLTQDELRLLTEEEVERGYRLACAATIQGDVTITVPMESRMREQRLQIEGIEQTVSLDPAVRNQNTYRHFGRLGLGALFGAKGLKAITISGKKRIRVKSSYYQEILKEKKTCTSCPIRCINVAKRESNSPMVAYDYELIYSFGPLLGIGKAEEILKLVERVERYGSDAMATGNLLAWATEACEKGLIELSVPLKFGATENYLETIDKLVEGEGIYADLRFGHHRNPPLYSSLLLQSMYHT